MKTINQILSKKTFNFLIVLLLVSCSSSSDDSNDVTPPIDQVQPWEMEVEELTAAMQKYLDFDTALNDGYDVDASGYVPQMGHHYVNSSLVNSTFSLLKPEILLYIPDGNGGLEFVAVEYVVPITDLNNPQPAPLGFSGGSDVWGINTQLSAWTLHVWIIRENSSGIFAPLNPALD